MTAGHPAGSARRAHLRLVTEETLAAELRVAAANATIRRNPGNPISSAAVRERKLPACTGGTHVYDGPDGTALPLGGIWLQCTFVHGHPGYCKDSTGFNFKPDRHSLHTDRVVRGKVVWWDGATQDDVLRLERELNT